ncbi:hypothetical protein ACFRAO_19550 [Streptomyces sp. NPDC056656]|uniref:hypothetical protein n=1 Tax=Streptomyces sp. NPDC056656 TaxID=3345895 RepID=UPI0036CB7939
MRRTFLTMASALCGIALLAGCTSDVPPPAGDGPVPYVTTSYVTSFNGGQFTRLTDGSAAFGSTLH